MACPRLNTVNLPSSSPSCLQMGEIPERVGGVRNVLEDSQRYLYRENKSLVNQFGMCVPVRVSHRIKHIQEKKKQRRTNKRVPRRGVAKQGK